MILDNLLTLLLLGAFACAAFFALNSLLNRNSLRRIRDGQLIHGPLVSVLIPCRNEKENIEACIDSILRQQYESLEILILDDHSTDGSEKILVQYADSHEFVTVIQGNPLPEGWTGKNWACHQLYERSKGEVLLYCDADTRMDENLVRDAVSELEKNELDFVTLFPQRESSNLFDRLVWSFSSWVIATWVPLWLAYQTRLGMLAVGFGQFLMIRRNTYEDVGGYEAFPGNSLDDFEIARRLQSAGIDWRVYGGAGRLVTASYRTTSEAIEGYSKSIFPAFRFNGLLLLAAWFLLANVTWTPVVVLIAESLGLITISTDQLQLASICVMSMLFSWAVAAAKLKIGILITVLYPMAITSVLYTAVSSYLGIRRGTITWKDRVICETRVDEDTAATLSEEGMGSFSESTSGTREP